MKFHRQSIRLRNYDYASQGLYYVTLCSQNRELYFENNDIKQMIDNQWQELKNKFPNIDLDKYVIMPNHIHGIIVITNNVNNDCRGEVFSPPNITSNKLEGGMTPPLQRKKPTLGQMIAYFKYQSTKQINDFLKNPLDQKLWQRNYYEHVIRNQKSLDDIRKYIRINPLNWDRDRNNPKNWKRC
ncbi:transposase [Patescibacteria group bacterium]|nr:transposase [Patescibacteria group bacterium]